MIYGKNTKSVDEVIDFIRKEKLFENGICQINDITIIRDYEKAKILAWSQNSDEVQSVWEGIKSSESAIIMGKLYDERHLNNFEDEIYEIFNSSENYIDGFIPLEYWDIFEEIQGDIYMCALNRLVNGKIENFYEKLLKIYKKGGWPCGWDGKYPLGKVFVFVPMEDMG
jgi:hypothetical protein